MPYPFELPPLPYAYDALEPYIDAKTMEIHHDKHHQGYVTNLNNALKDTDLVNSSLEEILNNISKYDAKIRNNAGGVYNHDLFWKILSPNGGGKPTGDLLAAIEKSFTSFDEFKNQFTAAAGSRFGSGWAWLGVKENGLSICSTPNQDNPLMDIADCQCKPLMGLDVWEHAYYLKYQNKRPDYIGAFWEIVNWDEVSKRYASFK